MQSLGVLTEMIQQGLMIPSEVSKPMAPTYSNHGLSHPRAKQLCPCAATVSELTSRNNLPSYKALNLIVVPQVIPSIPGSKRWRTFHAREKRFPDWEPNVAARPLSVPKPYINQGAT